MAYSLKENIFNFFGVGAKVNDTYKDVDGKGIWERYSETVGEQYDEDLQPLIDDFIANVVDPTTALQKMLIYLEGDVGFPISLYNTTPWRRKMLVLHHWITLVKGTLLSHEILYRMMGLATVVVTFVDPVTGFDSPLTLDSPTRTFDENLLACQHYVIELTGVPVLTSADNIRIWRIARYLKPIDGEIDDITYNAVSVPQS